MPIPIADELLLYLERTARGSPDCQIIQVLRPISLTHCADIRSAASKNTCIAMHLSWPTKCNHTQRRILEWFLEEMAEDSRSRGVSVMTQGELARWSRPSVILVATNLLEGPILKLHAMHQASLSGAKVLLVHVIPPAYLQTRARNGDAINFKSSLILAASRQLDDMALEFQQSGVSCEPIVAKGFPSEQISQLVQSRAVDRIIVGTRYAYGVARLVEPSIAEELITTLDIPVCVIGRRAHPGAPFGTPLGRILFATSFDTSSSTIAQFASTLAESNRADFSLLHVLDAETGSEQQRELARLVARQRLAGLVPKEARRRRQPEFLIRDGDPAAIILHESGLARHNLVVLAAPHVIAGTALPTDCVLHRVLVESQCPVIIIRSGSVSAHDASR
jgi:nucleotide-binding universal stress UspA family protein